MIIKTAIQFDNKTGEVEQSFKILPAVAKGVLTTMLDKMSYSARRAWLAKNAVRSNSLVKDGKKSSNNSTKKAKR